MNIIVHPGEQLELVTEFMMVNRISYNLVDLYD